MEAYDNPNMPRKFDESFFKDRILQLRDSPNVIHSLFLQWETRFKSRQERKILKEIEEWYNSIAGLSGAEAGAYLAREKAHDAKTDLDVSSRKEYQEERAKRKILGVQGDSAEARAKIAEAEARAREADQRGRPKEPEPKAPEKKKKTPEEYIAELEKMLNIKIGDLTRLDQVVAEKFDKLFEDEIREKAEVDRLDLPEAEKERRKGAINSRYTNLREEVNRLAYQTRMGMKKGKVS